MSVQIRDLRNQFRISPTVNSASVHRFLGQSVNRRFVFYSRLLTRAFIIFFYTMHLFDTWDPVRGGSLRTRQSRHVLLHHVTSQPRPRFTWSATWSNGRRAQPRSIAPFVLHIKYTHKFRSYAISVKLPSLYTASRRRVSYGSDHSGHDTACPKVRRLCHLFNHSTPASTESALILLYMYILHIFPGSDITLSTSLLFHGLTCPTTSHLILAHHVVRCHGHLLPALACLDRTI